MRGSCEASGELRLEEAKDEEESADVVAEYTARLGFSPDGQPAFAASDGQTAKTSDAEFRRKRPARRAATAKIIML